MRQRTADGYSEFIYQGPDMGRTFGSTLLQVERDENGKTKVQYTMGDGLEAMRRDGGGGMASGDSSFYHYNHLGTTMALTNAAASVSDTYRHDAWGVRLASTGSTVNPHTYVGRERYFRMPDAGFYHLGFRDYAQRAGRFTTLDPIRDGTNWFAYAQNMPTHFTDPSGQVAPIIVIGVVCFVVTVGIVTCVQAALPAADAIHKEGYDKLAHCVYHCQLTRCLLPVVGFLGAGPMAYLVGYVHEKVFQDWMGKGVYDPKDIDANAWGVEVGYRIWLNCEQGCDQLMPIEIGR